MNNVLKQLGIIVEIKHVVPKKSGVYITWAIHDSDGTFIDIITLTIHQPSKKKIKKYGREKIGAFHIHYWKQDPQNEKYLRLLLVDDKLHIHINF